jgi:hypothetical protein
MQRVDALVADQRLVEPRLAIGDIDQILNDAAFRAHDEIEIAQANVEVDDGDILSCLGERCAERRGRRRLADAAFPGCDDHNLGHVAKPLSVE